MKKSGSVVLLALLAAAAALPLYAQDGCVDSPENPTAILGLIVSAAGLGYMQLRNRFRNKNK